MRSSFFYPLALLVTGSVLMTSCKREPYALPTASQVLQNDCIERTLGPLIVGQDIEFAYAMAIVPTKGKLVSAQVEASVAGAAGTYMDNNSYYTDGSGNDVGVPVGSASVTKGATTEVAFTADTSAATLRYYYRIPEAARGGQVSFTFSAKSSDGESVSIKMGPYRIARMDMARNLAVSDSGACYISIADTAVYDAAGAAAHPGKIDLVYLYRPMDSVAFNHALVSPAADKQYLPGVTLPAGVNRDCRVMQVWDLQDRNLAQLQYGIYIDDLDFEKIDLSGAPDYAINLKSESGVWVQTQDSTYRAYIFVNSVDKTGHAVISMKRYKMK
jgi:hypothetical protein